VATKIIDHLTTPFLELLTRFDRPSMARPPSLAVAAMSADKPCFERCCYWPAAWTGASGVTRLDWLSDHCGGHVQMLTGFSYRSAAVRNKSLRLRYWNGTQR